MTEPVGVQICYEGIDTGTLITERVDVLDLDIGNLICFEDIVLYFITPAFMPGVKRAKIRIFSSRLTS